MSANDLPTRSDWPAAAVAFMIIALIGGIAVTAIIKYDTVGEALEMWSGLTALVGVVTGAFVAYFFTRGTVDEARRGKETFEGMAREAQRQAESHRQSADSARQDLQRARDDEAATKDALSVALGRMDPILAESLIQGDPTFRNALKR